MTVAVFLWVFLPAQIQIEAVDSKETRVITLGIHHNPPFTFKEEGEYKGFIVDILTAFCRKYGYELHFFEGEFNEVLEALFAGRIDVLSPLAYSAERAKKIRYLSDPIRIDAGNLILTIDSLLKDYSDLNHCRIGGVKGDLTFSIMKDDFLKNSINAVFLDFASFTEIADSVIAKKIDTGLILTSSYIEMQRTEKYRKKLKIMPAVMYTLPSFICTNLKRTDVFENLLLFIKEQKEDLSSAYSRSMDYWFSQLYTQDKGIFSPKMVVFGSVSIVSLILLILSFNLILRRKVKKATAEIERQKSYFFNMIKLMPAGITVMSTENRIVDVNSEFLSIFQFSENELIGQFVDQLIVPEEQSDEAILMTKKAASGQRVIAETQRRRKDGSLVHVGIVAEAIFLDGVNTGTIAIYIDRSEKMRFEEEILKAKSIEVIGVLAGGIAHDFNNMLTGILGNISLAKRLTQEEKLMKTLNNAEKAAYNAAGLTQQLLTFSTGGAPVKETASIEKIIKDSIDLVLSGSAIKPVIDLEPGLPLAEMDLSQMTQVFTNILLNAKQAMETSGKIIISAHRFTQIDSTPFLQAGQFLKVTITDEGKGIPPDLQEKIFTPFFTTKPKGTGLGLSVCYSVIKKHMGNIEVHSVPGEGTSFHIYLPTTEKSRVAPLLTHAQLPQFQRVLLMDDDEIIRDLFMQMLAEINCQITVCANSREVLSALSLVMANHDRFDMVFLDLTIPGDIGGVETLTQLRKIDPHLYAVATSGYSESKVFSDHKAYGFQDILPKPFTIEQLITRINTKASQESKRLES